MFFLCSVLYCELSFCSVLHKKWHGGATKRCSQVAGWCVLVCAAVRYNAVGKAVVLAHIRHIHSLNCFIES